MVSSLTPHDPDEETSQSFFADRASVGEEHPSIFNERRKFWALSLTKEQPAAGRRTQQKAPLFFTDPDWFCIMSGISSGQGDGRKSKSYCDEFH